MLALMQVLGNEKVEGLTEREEGRKDGGEERSINRGAQIKEGGRGGGGRTVLIFAAD